MSMSSSGITALPKLPRMPTTITPSDRVILAARVRRSFEENVWRDEDGEGGSWENVQLTLCMTKEVKSIREREEKNGGSRGCAMLLKRVTMMMVIMIYHSALKRRNDHRDKNSCS